MATTTVYAYGLSSAWSAETIALLLNKKLVCDMDDNGDEDHDDDAPPQRNHGLGKDAVRVQILPANEGSTPNGTASARITFASLEELETTTRSYQGLGVPMTHGYHAYSFSRQWPLAAKQDSSSPLRNELDSIHDNVQDTFTLPSETTTPPLHLQLMALPTKELEKRLQEHCMERRETSMANYNCPTTELLKGKAMGRVHFHASLASRLDAVLGHGRPYYAVQGVRLSLDVTEPLLTYLRTCPLWPPRNKQRKGVQSGHYLTLRQSHPPDHDQLWDLCRSLIYSVVPDACYTALAVTQAFSGSPHVDAHDTTHQHVVALGNFQGGELCADHGSSVVRIDCKNRLGRLDGRNVHWVQGWKGERFSVVYYSTDSAHYTTPQDQSVHNAWMESHEGKAT